MASSHSGVKRRTAEACTEGSFGPASPATKVARTEESALPGAVTTSATLLLLARHSPEAERGNMIGSVVDLLMATVNDEAQIAPRVAHTRAHPCSCTSYRGKRCSSRRTAAPAHFVGSCRSHQPPLRWATLLSSSQPPFQRPSRSLKTSLRLRLWMRMNRVS